MKIYLRLISKALCLFSPQNQYFIWIRKIQNSFQKQSVITFIRAKNVSGKITHLSIMKFKNKVNISIFKNLENATKKNCLRDKDYIKIIIIFLKNNFFLKNIDIFSKKNLSYLIWL